MTLLIVVIVSFAVSFVLGYGVGKLLNYVSDERDKRS
jgi:hypothetical protein